MIHLVYNMPKRSPATQLVTVECHCQLFIPYLLGEISALPPGSYGPAKVNHTPRAQGARARKCAYPSVPPSHTIGFLLMVL